VKGVYCHPLRYQLLLASWGLIQAEWNLQGTLVREKRRIGVQSFKHDQGMPMVAGPKDVMLLLNSLWDHAYGQIATNKNATSDFRPRLVTA
jgi:hypothetical protein